MILIDHPHDLIARWTGVSVAEWDYQPQIAPFQIGRSVIEGRMVTWGYTTDLVDAIATFALLVQPRPMQHAELIDGAGNILMGWYDNTDSDFSDRYKWFGCRRAFEMAAAVKPDAEWQLLVATWERWANKETL
jgi:hypothetical protein